MGPIEGSGGDDSECLGEGGGVHGVHVDGSYGEVDEDGWREGMEEAVGSGGVRGWGGGGGFFGEGRKEASDVIIIGAVVDVIIIVVGIRRKLT